MKYLDSTSPDAFVDWVKRSPWLFLSKECPVCKGYGGWNLQLNAYSLHDKPDTPENRHLYSHFRCVCSTCYGHGYVREDMTCTGHEWQFVQNLGRCYNQYKCVKCGQLDNVDSSD